jgi:protocatechuate 3,4-dioxygenase beta subunit
VIGGLGGLSALSWLVGCGGGTSSSQDSDGGATDTDGGATGDATSSASDGGTGSFTDATIDAAGFAVGSGAFLSSKDYGNPLSSGAGATCTVYGTATEGPCHSNTYLRKDVSDGLVGLPTRFEFLIVDKSCNPIPGAIVEIWYASPGGTYSKAAEAIDAGAGYGGSLSDLNVGFCTGNDATAVASNWLRGYQVADANGRVTIDGIFPGWYASRTTHVHFIVTANGHTSVTSQLIFDETLTTAIYTKHGSYSSRGNKDTTNANDMVVKGLTESEITMSYSQQSDGAIVAWKVITIT